MVPVVGQRNRINRINNRTKPIKESDKRSASIKFILKYNMYHTVCHNVDTIRPYSRITFYHTT